MMLFKRRHSIAILVVLFALLSAIPLVGLQAQGSANNVVLSIVVPEYMGDAFVPEVFTKFEEANPGVKVLVIKGGQGMYYPPAAYGIEEHFKGAEKYAASADVLFVSAYSLWPEAVRAGYFLDLAPLVTGDSTLNTDDFIPQAWQAFQWDKGIWGLPVMFDLTLLTYDPVAFDQAGVPYPNEKWTLDEFANAIRTLTKKDANGKVTIPGILAYNPGILFASLSGEKFYDNSVLPNPPLLNKTALEPLLDTWAKLMSEGILNGPSGDVYDKVPMRMDGTWGLASFQGSDRKPRAGSLLPGGKAGLDAQGFAVSGGTQHPDKAYALVKYLTTNARITNRIFGYSPARKSMVGAKAPDQQGDFFAPQNFSPEAQTVLDKALAAALPPSELRFAQYLDKAISRMNDEKDKLDAKSALQKAQDDAVAALKAADERRSKPIVVSTPIPTPVLTANEVSIKFNLMANVSPIPNKEQWDKAAKDFVESDPQVGQLVLDTGLGGGPDFLDNFDCYYLSYNRVAGGDTKNLLPLDPFLDTDPLFDKSDVVGGALAQLQKDNKTWGYPLVIQSQVLSYNTETFSKNNVPEPKNDWTIDAFNNALKALKVNASDPEPFVPRGYGGTYLIALVAAYGGLPLDYRTNPPTINFTDPATAEAIRQVLDLAKNKYIKYQELSGTSGGGFGGGPGDKTPLYAEVLSAISYRAISRTNTEFKDPYKLVAYPRGSKFGAISYDVGAAYISSKAQNAEACYRWISYLAKHPALFNAMPARRSLLNDPALQAAEGADVIALYKNMDSLLQDPSTIPLPSAFSSDFGSYLIQFFLYRAFDHYILKDADLANELKEAETFARSYQECVSKIPLQESGTDLQTYFKQFTDCAIKVDPSLKSRFGQTP